MNISGTGYLAGLNSANQGISQVSERISSGQRINQASDDAAGLAISNRLNGQVRGMSQAIRNANDGVSMLQTAGAGLESVTEGVQRLRELALQSANGTLSDSDRSAINKEAQQLMAAVQDSVGNTQFNGKVLLGEGAGAQLQVGENPEDQLTLELDDFAASLMESGFGELDFSSAEGVQAAIGVLDTVQANVDQANATIGAGLNRLESTVSTLTASSIQAEQSRSPIQDADMAKEITDLVNQQVKRDASIAMLALSNQQKGSVLKLLGQ